MVELMLQVSLDIWTQYLGRQQRNLACEILASRIPTDFLMRLLAQPGRTPQQNDASKTELNVY